MYFSDLPADRRQTYNPPILQMVGRVSSNLVPTMIPSCTGNSVDCATEATRERTTLMQPKWMSRSKGWLVFVLMLGLEVITGPRTLAQTFSVVHSFPGGTDGANPLAGLTIDSSGNLYGTASSGGDSGEGAVFKLNRAGIETVLYSFKGGTDGADPEAALILSEGNLYGTTYGGGASDLGTVFELTSTRKETVLHHFTGKTDGAQPQAGLAEDAAGNLYGTTFAGGQAGHGVVFKLTRPATPAGVWKEAVLHSFGSGSDGADPVAGVAFDAAGNLYGTTSAGGTYGQGTVFRLTPSASGWREQILHAFAMQGDGGVPYAGIILDSSGNLYGAATDGGGGGSEGGGTVFELSPSNSGWKFNVIYRLAGWGISGSFRNLLLASGKIYATTHCDGSHDAGTVYELTPSGSTWKYTSLHVFTGGSDGLYSFSNLVFDALGNLYGTTKQGGAHGDGVVFKVKP